MCGNNYLKMSAGSLTDIQVLPGRSGVKGGDPRAAQAPGLRAEAWGALVRATNAKAFDSFAWIDANLPSGERGLVFGV